MQRTHQTPTQLIEYQVLANNHALSFTNQPYLRALFDDIMDRSRPLTLITGAGVSINSALPDWEQLIRRIIEKIDEDELKDLATRFQAGPLRRAESILQLARRFNVNSEEYELIRDGLYQANFIARPGPLAESLARLVAARKSEVRIITTNFDLLFDEALKNQLGSSRVKSYGLNDHDEWIKHGSPKDLGVLHVHGVLRQGEEPTKPIILTESHYLKYGAKVREHISSALSGSVGLFVGLSLTDPNLLGPLYETSPQQPTDPTPSRYALDVAEFHVDVPIEKSARLAVESVRFLDDRLKLRPIIAKSYSQVDQIISDLTLAIVEPARYSTAPRSAMAGDLHYGVRLDRAMRWCYQIFGCDRPPYVPTGEAASRITTQLSKALKARNGPERLLNHWTSQYGIRFPDDEPERYGLHLWLRTPDKHAKSATYALSLIGSSTVESRESWYTARSVPIVRKTDYTAVDAVLNGAKIVSNMGPRRASRVWRGSLSIPMILRSIGSAKKVGRAPVDRLILGALTLTSTRYVVRANDEEVALDSTMNENLSVIARLGEEQLEKLWSSLERAAVSLLYPRKR